MIRATVPQDTPALLSLTEGTGVFSPIDLQALREVLDDYPAEARNYGHRCVTAEENGRVVGFSYFAPIELTDRSWCLWWIVVAKAVQATGLGGRLLRHVEDAVRAEKGRLMFLETSSLPSYDRTRRFYLKNGYEVAATLKDYYADGHDMVMYRKALTS